MANMIHICNFAIVYVQILWPARSLFMEDYEVFYSAQNCSTSKWLWKKSENPYMWSIWSDIKQIEYTNHHIKYTNHFQESKWKIPYQNDSRKRIFPFIFLTRMNEHIRAVSVDVWSKKIQFGGFKETKWGNQFRSCFQVQYLQAPPIELCERFSFYMKHFSNTIYFYSKYVSFIQRKKCYKIYKWIWNCC